MRIKYNEELFLLLPDRQNSPRDRQHWDTYLFVSSSVRQEMGLALRDQPRSGNEISQRGAHVLNRKTAPRRLIQEWLWVIYLDARHLTYVRTRYKFTLCFYHDCYYFLIKRYCAVPRPCSREQMMWNDELTRPCASYCSTFAPALVSTCHYRNDPFVLLVDTWSISHAVHDRASAGQMLRVSNTM